MSMSEKGDYQRRGKCECDGMLARVSVRLSCPVDLGRAAAAGGLREFDDPLPQRSYCTTSADYLPIIGLFADNH